MDNSFIVDVLEDSPMLGIEQGINIYHLLTEVLLLDIPGDTVELGCYFGLTAVIMQKTLDQYHSDKVIHVYDSFQGVPETTTDDGPTPFQKGWCTTTKEALIQNFEKFDTKLPVIHEGWFKDILPTQLPDQVCFAHLDGDMYTSIIESLENLYPRLSKGATVVIDDYCDPTIHDKIQTKFNNNVKNRERNLTIQVIDYLPGVKRACDDFFADKPEKVGVLISGYAKHGYFRKGSLD